MDLAGGRETDSDEAPAGAAEFSRLRIGGLSVWPPVVLAPMAGITNAPFRSLCRQFGAGLYVSEMVIARSLASGHDRSWKLAAFGQDEAIRSLQLYGVDPHFVGEAVQRLVSGDHVDHIDMNFGCPVRKVTRKGGGAALPLKRALYRNIVRSAVRHAGHVPVTVKFRIGIDDRLTTYLEAGAIAEDEGCAAVALHARTAAQLYDGRAQWEAIGRLKAHVRSIPVLGNGDIWHADDALRMMRQTGCDGVVVGRGCLGRPWLFRDLADMFDGRSPSAPPPLSVVREVMLKHASLLVDSFGEETAMRSFRKHAAWYTKGFASTVPLQARLLRVETLQGLSDVLSHADPREPFPREAMRAPRGKTSDPQKVSLPQGFLDDLDDPTPPDDGDGGEGG